jgi:tRNA1Val (adenine37-N6)-methyltransferase
LSKPFKFKEFTIHQDKTAMKVGTDGVLLGAWCSIDKSPDTILDVGAGTGVISLMMAQRSDAMTIDAVELDENAYEQTVDNFEKSDWGDACTVIILLFKNLLMNSLKNKKPMI